MNEWFSGMTPLERGFSVCAITGGILFLFRLVLQLFGGDDVDGGDISDGHGYSDGSFTFLSLHGITAFLLMFGLVGLTLLVEGGVREGWALAGATVGGLASMWGIAQVYMLMRRLQSSGNVVISNAVGKEGAVYLTIPVDGSGQVQIAYQSKMHIEDAISEDGVELKTGERVKVIAVRGGTTLVVRKALAPTSPNE